MAKNIVVCCDGTGNEYGRNNTNVVGVFERILRDDNQIAYYDPGLGTFSSIKSPLLDRFGLLLGKMFGIGIEQNVEDAYEYLMDRFESGDKVYIFGFSRGAYTARCLAGMLHKVGLLQKGSRNLIAYATRMYMAKDNDDVALGFKRTYSHECKPHFIGVWDTVGSLGYFREKKFKNNRLNHDVSFAYQAAAIDEKRKKFPISLWDEDYVASHQIVEQVWFSGVHSDVGGWYEERNLSDIALQWLLERAEGCGLRLHADWGSSLNPDPSGPMHESRTGLWKLWRPVTRRIPENALIHESVIRRMQTVAGYEPHLPEKYRVIPIASIAEPVPEAASTSATWMQTRRVS